MASSPITSWQVDGEIMETVRVYFLGSKNHCRWWLQPWNEKMLTPWKVSCDQPTQPEKAMASHSCILTWKIPWMEEPGRLQSMGSLRVGHDWATSLSLFTFTHWSRKWQSIPVFLPGESQGQGSMVGCRMELHRVGHDWSDIAAARAAYTAY